MRAMILDAMDLPALLHQYGYLLIFLGTLAEGETLLMLGGYFAHRGYLDLEGVILTSFVAAVCGDQLFFHLGRRHAKGLLERFPRLRDKVNLALRRVEDHQVKIVLSMRFLWGLRIALPVALGLTHMNARKFFWLNLLSAAVWSTVFAAVGFGTSKLVSQVFDGLHHYERWIFLAAALIVVLVLWLRWHGNRRALSRKT
jgi:membrane protein DedA with SNARE-associated domain